MKLLILGAGGHGRVVADVAKLSGRYDEILFYDDADQNHVKVPLKGKIKGLGDATEDTDAFVAIGDNDTRAKITEYVRKKGFKIATLIHPSAVISDDAEIGEGTVIMANSVVNNGAIIGEGVIINTAATVDHDCKVENYVHISPGAHLAGTVSIGEKTWVGIGASISNNLSICSGCMIGAGAVAVRSITESGVYVGIPAEKRL